MPRFFSDDSFWNQPVSPTAVADAESDRWIQTLLDVQVATHGKRGLNINLQTWTMPVYEADASSPRVEIHSGIVECELNPGIEVASRPYLHAGHPRGIHASFGKSIPLPPGAHADPQEDAHLVIIDRSANRVYDMWRARVDSNGRWSTNAAIAYDLNGDGVFPQDTITGIHDLESIHFYGPCRAAGVPLLAGLITRDEIAAGAVNHKLAFACQVNGLQRYQFPTIWTDGWRPHGIPAGAILQLDPNFDLDRAGLTPGGKAVARAMQTYGAVLVDYAGGVTLYGELAGTPRCPTWDPDLTQGALFDIDLKHYRILKTGPIFKGGLHPIYHLSMSRHFFDYVRENGSACLNEYRS